jgi:hypothetical protein
MLGRGSVIGGLAVGQGVTSSDPAFLRILAKSERYRRAVARQTCTFAKSIFLEKGTEIVSRIFNPLSAQTVLTMLIRCPHVLRRDRP